ncbi:MAG TPA: ferrous iron transport protein B, partial [Phycisphaerae bacterium]|nr:ferrous iron transport protein B [Phycisphaerae bacterium]
MDERMLTIALTGNPNAGKTTVFNALTGERQHVGNYPGVTVEKKEGVARLGERELAVVDLPGTYSLTAYSVEEIVARNFLIEQRPDVVVDIVDSSNLDRNLYLATQLLELGVPLVLAFNMFDVAVARGHHIDDRKLSALLGVPIVHTVGHKGRGLERLLARAVRTAEEGPAAVARQKAPSYGSEIEPHVEALTALLGKRLPAGTHHRWFAVKLLENDEQTVRRLRRLCPDDVEELLDHAGRMRKHIEGICGDSAEIILADRRYGFISGACAEAVRRSVQSRRERSERIDRVLLNRWIGLPVFALLMFLMFQLTFWAGTPAVDWLDRGKSLLADAVRAADGEGNGLLTSLLADGIIEGVGAVLSFVPLIVLLFLGIATLEDSGYMARAAFLLDRQMHRIGLHGKSFIPMLIGFGCTVPAILATRTLETRRDRLTTILILPLMSCGARLPVYVLLIGAFFGDRVLFRLAGVPVGLQGTLLFAVYLV